MASQERYCSESTAGYNNNNGGAKLVAETAPVMMMMMIGANDGGGCILGSRTLWEVLNIFPYILTFKFNNRG